MTFDDAIQEIYDLAVFKEAQVPEDDPWWNSNSQVVNLLEELRETYAPTIEMTQRAYEYLKEEHDKFIETGKDTFLSNNGLGNWRFNDENRVDIESGEAYIDEFTAAHNHFKGLTRTDVIQAWLHPETIKVVDK